jgi:hypothetical protein
MFYSYVQVLVQIMNAVWVDNPRITVDLEPRWLLFAGGQCQLSRNFGTKETSSRITVSARW